MKLSAIVPTWNEAAHIERCLATLRQEQSGEILVADGGSTDGTTEKAARMGAKVIASEKGLARQLNAAAAKAEGDVLWFVAADSRPEPGWFARIEGALASPYVVGGGFRLRLDDPFWGLRLIAWGGNFRARYLATTLPDQGLFVRRRAFEEVGGFDAASLIPYMTFCERLRERGEFRLLDHSMVSSARKWREGGVLRTTFRHWRIYREFRANPRRFW